MSQTNLSSDVLIGCWAHQGETDQEHILHGKINRHSEHMWCMPIMCCGFVFVFFGRLKIREETSQASVASSFCSVLVLWLNEDVAQLILQDCVWIRQSQFELCFTSGYNVFLTNCVDMSDWIPSVGRRVGGAYHNLPVQLYPTGPGWPACCLPSH